jgi:hypothetical protein
MKLKIGFSFVFLVAIWGYYLLGNNPNFLQVNHSQVRSIANSDEQDEGATLYSASPLISNVSYNAGEAVQLTPPVNRFFFTRPEVTNTPASAQEMAEVLARM